MTAQFPLGIEHSYQVAVSDRDCDAVRSILDSGVAVDLPVFGHGATALVWAAGSSEKLVNLLLERGAQVNVEDWEGVSPLRVAVQCKQESIVKILLAHGADPLRVPVSGPTPFDEAEQIGNLTILNLLKLAIAKQ